MLTKEYTTKLHTGALYDLVGTMMHAAGITWLKVIFATIFIIQAQETLTTRYPLFITRDRNYPYSGEFRPNADRTSGAVFNTLRTGDADLRFYITTVQDG